MLPAGAAPTHPDPVPNPVLSWDLTHRSRLQSGGTERVHCSAGERPRGKAAGPGLARRPVPGRPAPPEPGRAPRAPAVPLRLQRQAGRRPGLPFPGETDTDSSDGWSLQSARQSPPHEAEVPSVLASDVTARSVRCAGRCLVTDGVGTFQFSGPRFHSHPPTARCRVDPGQSRWRLRRRGTSALATPPELRGGGAPPTECCVNNKSIKPRDVERMRGPLRRFSSLPVSTDDLHVPSSSRIRHLCHACSRSDRMRVCACAGPTRGNMLVPRVVRWASSPRTPPGDQETGFTTTFL